MNIGQSTIDDAVEGHNLIASFYAAWHHFQLCSVQFTITQLIPHRTFLYNGNASWGQLASILDCTVFT